MGSYSHQDFAYYACDKSTYGDYTKNAADDPDNVALILIFIDTLIISKMLLWISEGAPGRCNEFADIAILRKIIWII